MFCTDYGLEDPFVGMCHGVIARVAPEARVIDLSHGVPAQDVLRGAILLSQSAPFMPRDAVYLAIVDPGVGMARRPAVVEAASGATLVGPDNGLLSLAFDQLGGAVRAFEITSPDVMLAPVSETFHGRDIFAPTAAHIARGLPPDRVGPPLDVEDLARVALPTPSVSAGSIDCEVLNIDRYGNLELDVRWTDLVESGLEGEPALEARTARGGAHRVDRVRTFGEVPEGGMAVLMDSLGWLAIVRNRGSAASSLGCAIGDRLTLRRTRDTSGS